MNFSNPPDPTKLLTEEEFLIGYPSFKAKGLTGIVAFHLAAAATLIDPKVWLEKTSLGHGLLTADMLCNAPEGRMAKMVPDTGISTYGKMYTKLVRIVAGKARVFT